MNAAKAFAQGMARSCRRRPRKSPTTSMCCRRSTTTQLSRTSLPSAGQERNPQTANSSNDPANQEVKLKPRDTPIHRD